MNVLRLGWIIRFFKWLKYYFCDTRNPIVQVRGAVGRVFARRFSALYHWVLCTRPV
jgi:hypothetical protein